MRDVYLVLLVTGISTALIGVFLVLRNLSMTADAISHSVLLGIVLAFFATRDLDSPWLSVGATIMGVLTVLFVELLIKTGKIKPDAALGIVFPLLFSIGVILISRYLRNVHLCIDSVIMGEVLMTPLSRGSLFGIDMPSVLVEGIIALGINLAYILVFYKELKISTFDPDFAILSGFTIGFIHYSLMTLVSFNAVVAFDAVGSILVISFLVAPAASAIMLTKDLKWTLVLSVVIAIINSTIGFYLGLKLNLNIAGITAFVSMIIYLICHAVKKDSYLRHAINKRKQLEYLNKALILIHIKNHYGKENQDVELSVEYMRKHLRIKSRDYNKAIKSLLNDNYISQNGIYSLTDKGLLLYDSIERENGI